MGLYQRLLRTVSRTALTVDDSPYDSSRNEGWYVNRTDRLLRTPLLFETLEPRVLLSSDPLSAAAQTALLNGLTNFENWASTNLRQAAQLAQQLPVVSTSLGDLVDLPGQIASHIVAPVKAYLTATQAPTIEGLAAALQADPAETAGSVLGSFAHGEFLVTLGAFKTSAAIAAPLNVGADSGGISLSIAPLPAAAPTLTGIETTSMALSFGFDVGSPTSPATFFIGTQVNGHPATIQANRLNDQAVRRRTVSR
jgi:hypothetical protein